MAKIPLSAGSCRYLLTLGLDPLDYEYLDDAEADIDKAYQMLATLHHPDYNTDCPAEAASRFQDIDAARNGLLAALGGLIEDPSDSEDSPSCSSSPLSSPRRQQRPDDRAASGERFKEALRREEGLREARALEAARSDFVREDDGARAAALRQDASRRREAEREAEALAAEHGHAAAVLARRRAVEASAAALAVEARVETQRRAASAAASADALARLQAEAEHARVLRVQQGLAATLRAGREEDPTEANASTSVPRAHAPRPPIRELALRGGRSANI